jgi:hypothetical protein
MKFQWMSGFLARLPRRHQFDGQVEMVMEGSALTAITNETSGS